ncbi:NAD(P)H-flavin reductase [Hathewaya proteolytica DSM 3090]|uniref:NAD(P)H-flavin reductase n=1 Tax=Hathewaya proteolytica DSM 3090 TaxID=1121331 RepID=A0A1M6KZ34_9CLOT|nr:sulfide/dihydroorotate dehydrogenase-like FAD/NAD-binding protein [Hathewaya proteolytica]SHJ64227.1 NAD(P)H-flavin reductase [Hathewaya proteolytica DSM 3090]
MSYELYECIDAGSEFCPCHLAETNQCIMCNNLNKKCGECHCTHWKGVCIYQEFQWNNSKAKEGRKYFSCKITERQLINNTLLIISVSANDYLIHQLNKVGSFVFLRRECDEQFFDAPISVMDIDTSTNSISFAIEIKGPKTENLSKLQVNDTVFVKGPFWNGVLGKRHIINSKNKNAVLICRGIGQAPMLPVLKYLCKENNNVSVIVDNGNYENCFIEDTLKNYQNLCNTSVFFYKTLVNARMTEDFKDFLQNLLVKTKPSVVYCSAADILNYEVMTFIEEVNNNLSTEESNEEAKINFACCNNAKMCCGEGICGGCTLKNNDRKLRHLCKMQTDPKYVLKGRRLL